MSSGAQRPFVSVKFSPVGRTYTFLLPELLVDVPASSSAANSQQPAASGQQPGGSQEQASSSEPVADRQEPEAIRQDPGSSSQEPAASSQELAAISQESTAKNRSAGPLMPGDAVIVQTAEGRALGTVTRTVAELAARKSPPSNSELQVVRRATRDDVITRLKHQHREQEAHRICLMKIRERGLAMKLTRVEQLFDGSRLIFYYTAEGRVDFRELVRDLAAHFRVRIEMRQIGVRDEARMLGGYGSCGRPLCCTTFLQTFEPISIKMAKQQNLSLNPSKLSGMCGRLKCCLRYELPNGKGVKHGGCADEGGCGSCSNPTGPGGGGGCGSCGPGGCGKCG
jgi:cell fate regulator YaaT (PSP1 superfamily)